MGAAERGADVGPGVRGVPGSGWGGTRVMGMGPRHGPSGYTVTTLRVPISEILVNFQSFSVNNP